MQAFEASDVRRLGEMVMSIRRTVMFIDRWDGSATLRRAWVVFELLYTAKAGAAFEVVMSDAERKRLFDAVGERDSGWLAVQKAFANVDVRHAKAYLESERVMIMGLMDEEAGGAPAVNTSTTCSKSRRSLSLALTSMFNTIGAPPK